MSTKRLRACNLGLNKTTAEAIIRSDDELDPFHTSSDEKDPDFQLPKKPHILQKKVTLTKRDRIEKLKKRITQKYSNKKMESVAKPTVETNDFTNEVIINLDASTSANNNNTEADIITKNYDDLFGDDIHQDSPIIEPVSKEFPNCDKENPVNESETNSFDKLFALMLELQNQIHDQNKDLQLLRKQVSRMELKTIGWPIDSKGMARFSGSSTDVIVGPEDLINFEATLAKEGLPIKTCVEINDLEMKLRREPEYKSKLVRI